MGDTEQALIEELENWVVGVGGAPAALAALRAALPEGVVLTRDGLARTTHVADFDWDIDQDTGLAEPFACNWTPDGAAYEASVPGSPLYTLTPLEDQ